MRPSLLLRSSAVVFFTCFLGCVIYTDDREQDLCKNVECGEHASCGEGICFCDTGYSGNPYNPQGCQPTRPDPDNSQCDPECGENAYCSNNQCVCNVGTVAVCDTGDCLAESKLCDGVVDCGNGKDEDFAVCYPLVEQTWLWTDDCNDSLDIELKLFSQDRDWVWPSEESVFVSDGYQVDTYQSIDCFEDETICFGAQSGIDENALVWGVGLDGTSDCDSCCFLCANNIIDAGFFTCE